jgi:hypothetical protein
MTGLIKNRDTQGNDYKVNINYKHMKEIKKEVKAWEEARNNMDAKINWQFTTEDARIKLCRLYPTFKE